MIHRTVGTRPAPCLTSRLRPLLLLALLATLAQADSQVIALRENNTSALRLRRQSRGLIVRDRQLPENPQAVSNLLLFCRQRGVDTLFISALDLRLRATYAGERDYRWRDMLAQAHGQGLDVYALTGDSTWLTNVGAAISQVDAIVQLGRRGLPGQDFDGVLFDFPVLSSLTRLMPPAPQDSVANDTLLTRPDGTSTTSRAAGQPADGDAGTLLDGSESTVALGPTGLQPAPTEATPELASTADLEDQALLGRYLDNLDRVRRYLKLYHPDSRLKLGVTVPAWMRTPLPWRGEVKFATDHFVDVSDFVVVHNQPAQTIDVAQAADGVLLYAGRTGKQVFLRLDVGLPPQPAPALLTLHGQDSLMLELTIADLRERHENTAGFTGVVIDDYQSYRRLPDRREEQRSLYGPGLAPTVPSWGDPARPR